MQSFFTNPAVTGLSEQFYLTRKHPRVDGTTNVDAGNFSTARSARGHRGLREEGIEGSGRLFVFFEILPIIPKKTKNTRSLKVTYTPQLEGQSATARASLISTLTMLTWDDQHAPLHRR